MPGAGEQAQTPSQLFKNPTQSPKYENQAVTSPTAKYFVQRALIPGKNPVSSTTPVTPPAVVDTEHGCNGEKQTKRVGTEICLI